MLVQQNLYMETVYFSQLERIQVPPRGLCQAHRARSPLPSSNSNSRGCYWAEHSEDAHTPKPAHPVHTAQVPPAPSITVTGAEALVLRERLEPHVGGFPASQRREDAAQRAALLGTGPTSLCEGVWLLLPGERPPSAILSSLEGRGTAATDGSPGSSYCSRGHLPLPQRRSPAEFSSRRPVYYFLSAHLPRKRT